MFSVHNGAPLRYYLEGIWYPNDELNTTSVYKCYGDPDRLLYVGITERNSKRFNEHHTNSDWWFLVDTITVKHYDTRREALDQEWIAIRDEQPLYNVVRRAPKHWRQ